MLTSLFVGCEQESFTQVQNTPINGKPQPEGMMKLGKKLENPFTVENIRKAYANLVKQGAVKAGLEITPTHQYVRFLPSDMEQFDMLELDTLDVMFDYPLDYDIEEGGTYYFDPELNPEVNPYTWQYVVVPINKPLPNVPYERLAELVLDVAALEKSHEKAAELWDKLETEALRISGNLCEDEMGSKGRWRPSGTITVWDDVVKRQIPLQGVKVRARWWFFFEHGYTNSLGSFEVGGTFKEGRKVNYSIVWERSNWDIREEDWGQAYYNGPKQLGAWSLSISSEKSLRYATIHRALLNYYYGDRMGLKVPYEPSVVKSKLKVGYYHHDHWNEINGSAIPFRNNLTIPHVCIYGKNTSGDWNSTDLIYSVTCHELAHVSHWEMIGEGAFALLWLNTKTRIIAESWATAVQWKLTLKEYESIGSLYGLNLFNKVNDSYNYQFWYKGKDDFYTPLFIDLIDETNQRLIYGSILYPNDNVSGFTISKLENILFGVRDFETLSTLLKLNKPTGVTNASIDELINFYKNI